MSNCCNKRPQELKIGIGGRLPVLPSHTTVRVRIRRFGGLSEL
jgi:hypothetical protein